LGRISLSSFERCSGSFFKSEIAEGITNDIIRKKIIFKNNGRIIFRVAAKLKFATVDQSGRFPNDIEYWQSNLGPNCRIRILGRGTYLKFKLVDDRDFSFFRKAIDSGVIPIRTGPAPLEGDEEADEEQLV
jgi:hypothetical protein